MKRSAPLRSDPAKTRAWQRRSAKPLPKMSEKVRADQPRRRKVREAVYERDGGCVLLRISTDHDCMGSPLTPHHIRKASQGGPYDESNLVSICAIGNSWLEIDRPAARALGLER